MKNRSIKPFIISAAVVFAAMAVIISAVMALRGRDSLDLEEAVYIYINGDKVDWPEGVRLIHRDDVTMLEDNENRQNLERYPLIRAEDGTIILQRSCSWNRTDDDKMYRMDYFGTVSRDESGILLSRRGKESRDISGFLYDNGDTYIFLEPATLSWGEKAVDIKAMTIVQVVYMDNIQIYGPNMEPYFERLEVDEVTAEFSSGKRLNLATDRYYQPNGSWRLLFLPLEALKELGTGGAGNEKE